MMGATHGLAGLSVGCAVVLAASAAGDATTATTAAIVITAAALAAELPDLDQRGTRISKGTGTLAAVPGLWPLAMLITLPIVLAGIPLRLTLPLVLATTGLLWLTAQTAATN